jgi:NADH dehydrogenase
MSKISFNDTITIFGGGGFIGKYLVKELAKTGAKVKIASRRPELAQNVKMCGAVGQIAGIKCDAKDKNQVRDVIRGSSYVVNLIGILAPSRKQNFDDAHVTAARNIAESANEEGVIKLVHISALGIDESSKTSKYALTKLKGEQETLKANKASIILRPSVVFGPEDNFINLFNTISKFSPILPAIGGGESLFQPVYVNDLAKAIVAALTSKESENGSILEIGGAKTIKMLDIYKLINTYNNRHNIIINVPFSVAKLPATLLELLPCSPLTRDQVELLKYDNVVKHENGLQKLGINPEPLEVIAKEYIN